MPSQDDLLRQIPTTAFQTSDSGFQFTSQLKEIFGVPTNAKIARLAIGRSLGENSLPKLDINSKGNIIKGNNLFTLEESALWIGLIVTHSIAHSHPEYFDIKAIQNLVKGHWHRGAELLMKDYEEAGNNYTNFIELLLTRRANLPLISNPDSNKVINNNDQLVFNDKPAPVSIHLGFTSDKNAEVSWTVNGVGYSPHIAIMGQAGSGKTRIMLTALSQIQTQSNSSVVLIDLGKGDLADNKQLANDLNATVLRVPSDSIPLDLFYSSQGDESTTSDMVLSFRDSFSKVASNTLGANQKDNIRNALKPLFLNTDKVSLSKIRDTLINFYEEHSLKNDTVISTINDLNERILFDPVHPPHDFFNKNWIITFGGALETYKMLSAYLLLDSLNYYNKSIPEAATDTDNHRTIRTVLAIDEARSLLSSKHVALSDNIRLHRSKGLVVILSSQSPDDYEGESDDYLENIGLPVCLKTNARSTQVLQNMFKSRPNFSTLKNGECLTNIDNKTMKVKIF